MRRDNTNELMLFRVYELLMLSPRELPYTSLRCATLPGRAGILICTVIQVLQSGRKVGGWCNPPYLVPIPCPRLPCPSLPPTPPPPLTVSTEDMKTSEADTICCSSAAIGRICSFQEGAMPGRREEGREAWAGVRKGTRMTVRSEKGEEGEEGVTEMREEGGRQERGANWSGNREAKSVPAWNCGDNEG